MTHGNMDTRGRAEKITNIHFLFIFGFGRIEAAAGSTHYSSPLAR
jgi:hypothetical protein